MNIKRGIVYWITGLSGAGKTTVGTLLYEKIRAVKDNVVILDGDALREVFGGDLGFTAEERLKSAGRNARLCRMLSDEGIDVVCCTISMYDEIRDWNRKNIENYREVYLKVSDEVLKQRNQKGLYETSQNKLVGFGVKMEEPKNPDMVFVNDGGLSPEEIAQKILEPFSNI